jgi:hypothetical protein
MKLYMIQDRKNDLLTEGSIHMKFSTTGHENVTVLDR